MSVQLRPSVRALTLVAGLREQGAETAFVIRGCKQGLREVKCFPEEYGGTVQCYCQTDLCNGDRPTNASSADLLLTGTHDIASTTTARSGGQTLRRNIPVLKLALVLVCVQFTECQF